MRKRLVAIALVLAGAAAVAPREVLAQDQAEAPNDDLRSGRARLDFLAGDWRVEQFSPTHGGEWRSNGLSDLRFRSTMNDLYLETNASAGAYAYHIVFSFDAAQQQYRVISRDDQSGLIDVYEGTINAQGALVVSNVDAETYYVHDGVRYQNRMSFTPAADGWVWLVDVSDDGGQSWRPQVRAVARR